MKPKVLRSYKLIVTALLLAIQTHAAPLQQLEQNFKKENLRYVTTIKESDSIQTLMVRSDKLTYKLIEKYPLFCRVTPLNIPLMQDGEKYKALLLSSGSMEAVAGIPRYAGIKRFVAKTKRILKNAGLAVESVNLSCTCPSIESVTTLIRTKEDMYEEFYEETSEDFQAALLDRIEKAGFSIEAMDNLEERLAKECDKEGVYDFFNIFSVEDPSLREIVKRNPRAAVVIPWTLYHYKRSGDVQVHLGFMDILPALKALGITDKETLQKVKEAQQRLFETFQAEKLKTY